MKNTINFPKPDGLIDFLYPVHPQKDLSFKDIVVKFKEKHDSLCSSYFTFLKSELFHQHLVHLLKDYENLLKYFNELLFLNKDVKFRPILLHISSILEETALAIAVEPVVKKEVENSFIKRRLEYSELKYKKDDSNQDDYDDDDEEWESF